MREGLWAGGSASGSSKHSGNLGLRWGGARRRKALGTALIAALFAAMSVVLGASTPMLAHAGTSGLTEFAIPSNSYAYPDQIAGGPDGNLWFTENIGSNIGQITPSGTITEFPDPANTGGPGTNGIAAGPDGNLWFTTAAGNTVGKITTAGAVTEYAQLQTPNARPNIMVAGPNGNMWFTEESANFVGTVSMSGAITEYPITASAESEYITVGPDRNLWFTESSLHQVARMTTSGALTEFPLAAGSQPDGIATGPDGNLWVTEYGTGNIDKIDPTTGSVLAQYPTNASGLGGINVGPDGNMWFASLSGLIGEVSTGGTVTEYPTTSSPVDVIAGPDGNVWYTAHNQQIGRLDTQSACLTNSATPSPVDPGAAETIGITVSDCSASGLNNASTATTTTVPSGCPAAPAIPAFTDTLASGESSAHTAPFTAPSCPGDYTVVTQTTVGGTVVASTSTTYHVRGPGDGELFPTSSRPGYIAAGSDGNLWFTDSSSNLNRVTPAGVIRTFSSAINGGAGQLVTGANGDLYVNTTTGSYPNVLSDIADVQLNAYGPVFKWEVPVTGTSVNDLAPGPDGNVWFAGNPSGGPGGTIGFVTTAAKVKLFQLPAADGAAVAITSGSDGGLWFLLASGDIGRISTSGAVSLFTPPAGTSFGGSGTATLGPDGNVWFTGADSSGDIVGRITPTGAVSEFATLQPGAQASGITAGADGNLWFNQSRLNSCGYGSGVGRVTPSGVLSDFYASCIDTNDQFNIVAGPDGNVWNAAYYGIGVAKILTGAPSTCTPLVDTVAARSVTHRSPEAITAVIHNCSMTPQLMKLTSKTTSTCGSASTTAQSVPLQPLVQTTVSISAATTCKGKYTDKLTLSAGGSAVASAKVTWQVT